jgi:hypothetical protein
MNSCLPLPRISVLGGAAYLAERIFMAVHVI